MFVCTELPQWQGTRLEAKKQVKVNDTGELSVTCSAKGRPAPVITWYRNGLSVDDALFSVTSRSTPVNTFSWTVVSTLAWTGNFSTDLDLV